MTRNKMDCHATTDIGRKRKENEDHFLIADLVKAVRIQSTSLSYDDQAEVAGHSQGKVLLVADGMGGQAAGRRASTVAVDETINFMVNRMQWFAFSKADDGIDASHQLSADLVSALKSCQRRIQREAEWNPDSQGMGTTLTVAIVDWPTLHIVHAGDSRCYLYHEQALQQLTRDHTVAQVYVDAGQLSESEAEQSPLNSALWNVVGGPSSDLDPEFYTAELSIGDTLLLCTDGLTKHVSDEVIAEVLRKQQSARQACEELVELANAEGGSDNITVLVAHFADDSTPPQAMAAETTRESASSSPEVFVASNAESAAPSSAEQTPMQQPK